MGRRSPGDVKQAEPTPETLHLEVDRCDAACPAQAQVHVIRHPDRELAFCGHHFNQHALALMSSGWQPADLGRRMQANAPQPASEPRCESDDEDAAREWADEEAAKIGHIWARRYPDGRDWLTSAA